MSTINASNPAAQSATNLTNAASCNPAPLAKSASAPNLGTSLDSYEGPSSAASAEESPKPVKLKKMGYSQFMTLTKKWENEPNKFLKVIQLPLAPAYVILDMAMAPLVPLANIYEFFYNRRVDATNLLNGV